MYYTISYDIRDRNTTYRTPPLAVPVIESYGGKVLASDMATIAAEGNVNHMYALISFLIREAAVACYNDPRCTEVVPLRTRSTTNCTLVLVNALDG